MIKRYSDRSISAESFLGTVSANVNSERMNAEEFREFVRNTIGEVQYHDCEKIEKRYHKQDVGLLMENDPNFVVLEMFDENKHIQVMDGTEIRSPLGNVYFGSEEDGGDGLTKEEILASPVIQGMAKLLLKFPLTTIGMQARYDAKHNYVHVSCNDSHMARGHLDDLNQRAIAWLEWKGYFFE